MFEPRVVDETLEVAWDTHTHTQGTKLLVFRTMDRADSFVGATANLSDARQTDSLT